MYSSHLSFPLSLSQLHCQHHFVHISQALIAYHCHSKFPVLSPWPGLFFSFLHSFLLNSIYSHLQVQATNPQSYIQINDPLTFLNTKQWALYRIFLLSKAVLLSPFFPYALTNSIYSLSTPMASVSNEGT